MPRFSLFKKEQNKSLRYNFVLKKKQQPLSNQSLNATMGVAAVIRESVKLPEGGEYELNEWIAMNTLELFDTMNLCYGIVSQYCTDITCPKMTAGPKVTYFWAESGKKESMKITPDDNVKFSSLQTEQTDVKERAQFRSLQSQISPGSGDNKEKEKDKRLVSSAQEDSKSCCKAKFKSYPAPRYIEKVVIWVSEQFRNPSLFPTANTAFSSEFMPAVKKIMSRMFRVYAHVYHNHWEKVKSLGAEPHVNTSFKHFYYFAQEFNLLDEKELVPMKSVIDKIKV